MLMEVVCEYCDGKVVARTESNDPHVLGLLMMVAHASPPHNAPHALSVRINGAPMQAGSVKVRFVCLAGDCANKPLPARDITYEVPRELAAVVGISFHSVHEGHALEVWHDGVRIHPPT